MGILFVFSFLVNVWRVGVRRGFFFSFLKQILASDVKSTQLEAFFWEPAPGFPQLLNAIT